MPQTHGGAPAVFVIHAGEFVIRGGRLVNQGGRFVVHGGRFVCHGGIAGGGLVTPGIIVDAGGIAPCGGTVGGTVLGEVGS
ncbi:MAG TPA: hypothetical protein VE344_01095 [Methylomirabilota bacterium]|nr:hypothetical protein [Methylomirabilota bacterium]